MPRLFFGNFDFEHELANPLGWQASAQLQRLLAERAPCWIALADDGDFIWTPQPIADAFWDELSAGGLPRVRGVVDPSAVLAAGCELVPWGWSRRAMLLAGNTPRPIESSVHAGNSRSWSFELEREFGVELPGSARIERLEDFTDVVSRSASEFSARADEHAWVIKANFGMSARERILGRGSTLTEPQRRWLQRRLTADGVAFFEPWLRVRAEVGVQITVPSSGQGVPRLEGLPPLLTDSQGSYRGSRFSFDDTIPIEWQSAVEVCLRAATRLQALGYFGPLGIDAGLYEDSQGRVLVRPLQDINARFTMGRLALGFRRLLKPHESGVWRHSPILIKHHEGRVISTTPVIVGDRAPSHRSVVVIGQSCHITG